MKQFTAQNMKFSIKDFFSKCDQICRKLLIRSNTEDIAVCRLPTLDDTAQVRLVS